MVDAFPPRIHVLLARRAPLALVIRRGPADSVCTIAWNRSNDSFQLGQWLRGRIYERRSDLSPDGRYFLYFALNGKWTSETRGSWTAVSRTPYLKALALFPSGNAWLGGGLFLDDRSAWLNDGCTKALRDTPEIRFVDAPRPADSTGGECLSVYYPRLTRDGWLWTHRRARGESFDIFEKALPHGWRLRKYAHAALPSKPGAGAYWDEHELVSPHGESTPHEAWEWADGDGERLVWAENGRLFAAKLGKRHLSDPTELFNFSDMRFEAIAAPY